MFRSQDLTPELLEKLKSAGIDDDGRPVISDLTESEFLTLALSHMAAVIDRAEAEHLHHAEAIGRDFGRLRGDVARRFKVLRARTAGRRGRFKPLPLRSRAVRRAVRSRRRVQKQARARGDPAGRCSSGADSSDGDGPPRLTENLTASTVRRWRAAMALADRFSWKRAACQRRGVISRVFYPPTLVRLARIMEVCDEKTRHAGKRIGFQKYQAACSQQLPNQWNGAFRQTQSGVALGMSVLLLMPKTRAEINRRAHETGD